MAIGEPGSEGARVDTVQGIDEVFDLLLKYGHREVPPPFPLYFDVGQRSQYRLTPHAFTGEARARRCLEKQTGRIKESRSRRRFFPSTLWGQNHLSSVNGVN